MLVVQVVEITKEDYESVKGAELTVLEQFAAQKAAEAGYHPAGYDCWNPKVYEKEGKFYLEWKRNRSCD